MIHAQQIQSNQRIMSDEFLVKSAQENPTKFEALYEKYYNPIFRFIWQRTTDKDDAHDITSQVFIKALSNINKYKYRGIPFSSWLFQISRNELNDYYRKSNKTVPLKIDNRDLTSLYDECFSQYQEELVDSNDFLIELINELNDDEIFLIESRYFEKRSFREISEILNITENNAKVKTYRILEKMRKIGKNKML